MPFGREPFSRARGTAGVQEHATLVHAACASAYAPAHELYTALALPLHCEHTAITLRLHLCIGTDKLREREESPSALTYVPRVGKELMPVGDVCLVDVESFEGSVSG